LNHYSKCCRGKNSELRTLTREPENFASGGSVYTVDSEATPKKARKKSKSSINSGSNQWHATMNVENYRIKFKLDTGAQVSTIPYDVYCKMKNKHKLLKTGAKVTTYDGSRIPVKGKCVMQCTYKGQTLEQEFIVVDLQAEPILSLSACIDFDLLARINTVESQKCANKTTKHQKTNKMKTGVGKILDEYSEVFEGMGCLKQNTQNISLKKEAKPVIDAPRKIPIALREKVEKELNRMEALGVVEKVEKPSQLVSSMVVVEKANDQIRICLDPRNLNQAIHREHYQLPTAEEISSKLTGAKYFSVLDASQGFWQIPLDEESSEYTAFNTPFGRYKFLRLPFGISSAPEIFHRIIAEMLEGIEGACNYIDDVLVWGSTREEHDNRLRKVLDRVSEQGLKLKREKCKEAMTELKYIGGILTSEGTKPDKTQIEAIVSMPIPESKDELQRFLGMVTYFAKYVPDMSSTTAVLRELLKKEVSWFWDERHELAIQKLKQQLTSAPVLAYYDPTKPAVLSVDASQKGLGAVLLQEGRAIAFASRALNETEQRYAQIEKETLALVFGCERFHHYLYGRVFEVESDHKPLEAIMVKSLNKAPPRIQRFLLRLQKYQFKLKFVPGKYMFVSDTLSRAYMSETVEVDDDIEIHVHTLVTNVPVKPDTFKDLVQETSQDVVLQRLKQTIIQGWPETRGETDDEIKPYWNGREEYHVAEGLIFKGDRIVVPKSRYKTMLQRTHEGHMGMELCKNRAREVIYWPGMNGQIEQMVSSCAVCQKHTRKQTKEPLITHPIPDRPWQNVSSDLFYWAGKEYLLVVDSYSGYPELAVLHNNSTSQTVINHLKAMFARQGIPEKLMTDNGPQYASRKFKDFVQKWGITHITSSPLYPQSNGLAERTVETVKNLLRKAAENNEDPLLALLAYRSTPKDNGLSPSELLMGRKLRTRLPMRAKLLNPKRVNAQEANQWMKKKKQRQKKYFDRGSKELPKLKPGDKVRIKQNKIWIPGKILREAQYPRSYEVECSGNGQKYRRNRRDLLKIPIHSEMLRSENQQNFEYENSNENLVHERNVDASDAPLSTEREENVQGTPERVNRTHERNPERNPERVNRTPERVERNPERDTDSSVTKTRTGRVINKPNRYGWD